MRSGDGSHSSDCLAQRKRRATVRQTDREGGNCTDRQTGEGGKGSRIQAETTVALVKMHCPQSTNDLSEDSFTRQQWTLRYSRQSRWLLCNSFVWWDDKTGSINFNCILPSDNYAVFSHYAVLSNSMFVLSNYSYKFLIVIISLWFQVRICAHNSPEGLNAS